MSRPRKSRYARLQGTAWRHRVTSALSVEGMSLWARCLSYCPDSMSDGVIPEHMLGAIKGGRVTEKQLRAGLAELLDAGLLTRRDDGDYEMRGYLEHNISRADDESLLEKDRNRKGNGGSFRLETAPVSEPIPCTSLTHDSGLMTKSESGARAPVAEPEPERERPLRYADVAPARPRQPTSALTDPSPEDCRKATKRALESRQLVADTRREIRDLDWSGWHTLASWCHRSAQITASTPRARLNAALTGWLTQTADKGCPISFLAKNPDQYATTEAA